MIKLFFIIFFIAELIIAFSFILKIWQFDCVVNRLNNKILSRKSKLKWGIATFRTIIKSLGHDVILFKHAFKKKRQIYLMNFSKNIVSYILIFVLKGKYKKAIMAYQLGKEIVEGIIES